MYKRSTCLGDIGAFHPPLPNSAATIFGGREASQAMALAPFLVPIISTTIIHTYYNNILLCVIIIIILLCYRNDPLHQVEYNH